MRIAFFDSGVGGLTVMREACRALPGETFLYYADTANVPYGIHTKEEVFDFVAKSIDDIVGRYEVKAIVIACNTATSVAVEALRSRYPFPIIGMEPAVKPALQAVRESGKQVLVTATPLTLKEEKFQRLIRKLDAPEQIDTLGLPELVRFAEAGQIAGPGVERYLQEQLSRFRLENYGAIVLGCTHFVFFRETIADLVPAHIAVMDGNAGTVNQLLRVLGLHPNKAEEGANFDIHYMTSRHLEHEVLMLKQIFSSLV